MTPATLREQAAMRFSDAWVWWISTARPNGYPESPHDTDARDTYETARDALTAAREDHP